MLPTLYIYVYLEKMTFSRNFFEHLFDFPRFYFRDETFKRSLAKLREDILRANGLAREANNFAEELGRPTRFSVTLQIPPQNLSPNRKVRLQLLVSSISRHEIGQFFLKVVCMYVQSIDQFLL